MVHGAEGTQNKIGDGENGHLVEHGINHQLAEQMRLLTDQMQAFGVFSEGVKDRLGRGVAVVDDVQFAEQLHAPADDFAERFRTEGKQNHTERHEQIEQEPDVGTDTDGRCMLDDTAVKHEHHGGN